MMHHIFSLLQDDLLLPGGAGSTSLHWSTLRTTGVGTEPRGGTTQPPWIHAARGQATTECHSEWLGEKWGRFTDCSMENRETGENWCSNFQEWWNWKWLRWSIMTLEQRKCRRISREEMLQKTIQNRSVYDLACDHMDTSLSGGTHVHAFDVVSEAWCSESNWNALWRISTRQTPASWFHWKFRVLYSSCFRTKQGSWSCSQVCRGD